MVAIAPPSRDDCPCTPNGDTVSPTSARFLITTPSNGARTLVFSIASSVTRTRARAEAIEVAEIFVARGGCLRQLRLGLRDGAARGLELCLDFGVLDLGDHLPL